MKKVNGVKPLQKLPAVFMCLLAVNLIDGLRAVASKETIAEQVAKRRCLSSLQGVEGPSSLRLEELKKLTGQQLTELVTDIGRGLAAMDSLAGNLYVEFNRAVIEARDRNPDQVMICPPSHEREDEYKKLVMAARIGQKLLLPGFTVNEGEKRGYVKALTAFLLHDGYLQEAYAELQEALRLYWSYHGASSLGERVGLVSPSEGTLVEPPLEGGGEPSSPKK